MCPAPAPPAGMAPGTRPSCRLLMRAASAVLAAGALLLMAALPARAASLIRDADIEYALARIAAPVLSASGLNANRVRVLLTGEDSMNAFIVDSSHIFINAGLMMRLESAAQLQAVIAHEAAHIANGHIGQRAVAVRGAKGAAALGTALAAAAAATGNVKAAGGLLAGATGAAQGVLAGHTRAQEAAADQSGIRAMVRAGAEPAAMLEVLDLFRGQEALSAGRQDPYVRTHPLTRERIRAITGYAAAYGGKAAPDDAAAYWFARAKGKLSAFRRAPSWTLRRAGQSYSRDITLMRQAVAHHRAAEAGKALAAMEQLLALRPKDPFVHDLHGQILLESRRPAEAVRAYGKAAALAPGNAQILGGQGRALLAAGRVSEAVKALENARARDWRDPRVLRDLASAHAQAGQMGQASLATAERYALTGRMDDAALHARRAAGLLPRGSAPWQRAQDVLHSHQALSKGNRG